MSPEELAAHKIGVWECSDTGNGCHIDYVMHYFYKPFGDEHHVYECEAVIEAAYWSRSADGTNSKVGFYEPRLCDGPFYGMCGKWVNRAGGHDDAQAAFNEYNQWGSEYWRTDGSEPHCGPVYGGPSNPWPDPEPDEDCIDEYQSGTETRMCEETLLSILAQLRLWFSALSVKDEPPPPDGPGPEPPPGGPGPEPPPGGPDPEPDPEPGPSRFGDHPLITMAADIEVVYVDLQARLDVVRASVEAASVDRFPFVVMRYVPELAEDGSPASPCNDIVITLVGMPTALGWCGSGVQAFLTGWGRSIMGVLVTVVYGFGMAHTVVRS
jgi:hypothetical protein